MVKAEKQIEKQTAPGIEERNPLLKRRTVDGVVVSDKMQKTIVVKIDRLVQHPLYPRTLRSSNTFKAHDEKNAAKIGDLVRIMETRPLSKNKCWRLLEIVRRGSSAEPVPTGAGGAAR